MPNFADLPSQYDHAAAQEKWYPHWEKQGYFHADPQDSISGKKPPYTIVIPPPNVTGALHLGHALNNTLQDILIRMKRMQGYNTLWMPGTDHAGIATQARVEKRILETEGKSRHDLGREGLVDRIWEWKDQYEARILGQLKQLGCSCDWDRTRFTLDDTCATAVRETFFKLFSDGKIYRGKRLVNWDTYLQTAVSDDEVFHEEVKGHFWHFRYPAVDPQPGEPTHVTIATTRPETMLGDTAVAVHPDPAKQLAKVEAELKEKLAAAPEKERAPIEAQLEALAERKKAKLSELEQLRDMAARGVMLELPLTGRQIPLIADIWAKPELGSGCVKITPAHDANDYEVWQRNEHIGTRNILNPDGTLNENVPEKYRGLTMKKARTAVLEDLAECGAHDSEKDVEDRVIDLAHSDRSKTPIEPYLADQWFVKMDELAQSAMDAVTSGKVKITPERYAKSYLDWLSEKRDWPVGRQLWWGHRIPVWEASTTMGGVVDETFKQKCYEEQAHALEQLKNFLKAVGAKEDDYQIDILEHWRIRVCSKTEKIDRAFKSLVEFKNSFKLQKVVPGRPTKPAMKELPVFPDATRAALEVKDVHFLRQEEDVLDTWFSSALWPHSTLGWPQETDELKAFYPTSTLITSRDIITLWVARMVLMGEYNMGEVPFKEVYIHPKILDGFGETMSKSKGNGIDPLDVIQKFGADALRFGIAYLTTETQDVRMPVEFECPHCQALIKQTKKNRILPRIECEKCNKPFSTQWAEADEDTALERGAVVSDRFELGRNFCNKLWNAARFSLINLTEQEGLAGYKAGEVAESDLLLEDRWLLSRLATVTNEVTEALDTYRYADAARTLYDFAWDEFCSFYLEMTKARFGVPAQRATAQRMLAHGLDTLVRLLHPMIPFLTEEIWDLMSQVAPDRGLPSSTIAEESVCVAGWPEANKSDLDKGIEDQFAEFQAVLGAVREIRSRQNVAMKEKLTFRVDCPADMSHRLAGMAPYFEQMANAAAGDIASDAAVASIQLTGDLAGSEVHVDISDHIDVEAETKRLTGERDKLTKYVKSINGKLSNEKFVAGAPAAVVEAERHKLADAEKQLTAVVAALEKL